MPYGEVYGQYAAAAAEAIESEYIPPTLQEYVREYFSQLEP